MSTDHPATTFINFFPKKYLLAVYKDIMVIPVLLHCVLGKHLVKIDELWPNGSHYITKYHKVQVCYSKVHCLASTSVVFL